jgi:gliding motility-associated-like protein
MKKITLFILCVAACLFCNAQKNSGHSLQIPNAHHNCNDNKSDKIFDRDHALRHIQEITCDPLEQDSLLEVARQRFEIITHRPKITRPQNKPSNNQLRELGAPLFDCTADNWNFEQGDLNGWTTTGNVAIVNAGNDPYGNYPWVYPGGGDYSVKISGDRDEEANGSISREIVVPDSGATYFSFHFAVSIFNYPHLAYEAAKFKVEFFDQNNSILPCPNFLCYYSTDLGAQGVSGFQQTAGPAINYNPNANGAGPDLYEVTYSSWNDVTLDLSVYAGQTITAKFTVEWCIYSPDWCYALLDVDCPINSMEPIVECVTFPSSICGPPDMATYHWFDENDNEIGNTACLMIQTPGEYFCRALPAQVDCTPGTEVVFHYSALDYPVSDFTVQNAIACSNDPTVFMSQAYSNPGQAFQEWFWDFGNGMSATTQNPEIIFSNNGDYQVQLTTSINGCSSTSTQTININDGPTAIFSTETSCDGNGLHLIDQSTSSQQSIIDQQWDIDGNGTIDASGPNPFIDVLNAGEYPITLTVTDSNNCTHTATSNVTIYPVIEANVEYLTSYNGYNISCFDYSDGEFVIHPTGGFGEYTMNSTDVNIEAGVPVVNLPAGVYTVQITDSRGCTITETIALNQPPPIVQQLTVISNYNGSDISCFGHADGQAATNISGGVEPYEILWSDMSTSVNSFVDLDNEVAQVLVSDANGCISEQSILIQQPDPIQVEVVSIMDYNGFHISCNGLDDGEVTVSAQGGVGAIHYTWDGTTGSNYSAQLSAGWHTATAIDSNGCIANVEFELLEPEALECNAVVTSNFNGHAITCPYESNGEATASAIGGAEPYQFVWSNDVTGPTNTTLSTNDTWVKIYDANNCLSMCYFELNEPTPLSCAFNVIPDTCDRHVGRIEASVLGGVPGYSIEWAHNNQSLDETQMQIDQLSNGMYSATVIDANGCLKYFEMEVSEIPPANINVLVSPTPYCSDTPLTFSVASDKEIVQWNWTFDRYKTSAMAVPTVDFLEEGSHVAELSVVDEHLCPAEVTFEFDLQLDLTLYIPNTFTPNNDGINDVFGVEGLGIDKFEMKIYDRWGTVIFESHNLEDKWTGNYKEGDYYVQSGSYLYVVTVSGTCTESKEVMGNVLLIR